MQNLVGYEDVSEDEEIPTTTHPISKKDENIDEENKNINSNIKEIDDNSSTKNKSQIPPPLPSFFNDGEEEEEENMDFENLSNSKKRKKNEEEKQEEEEEEESPGKLKKPKLPPKRSTLTPPQLWKKRGNVSIEDIEGWNTDKKLNKMKKQD